VLRMKLFAKFEVRFFVLTAVQKSATTQSRGPLAGIVKDNTDIKKGRRKMKIETHNIDDTKIAEVNSDETIINNTEDGLD
jgi:hypothetical protein